MALPVRSKTALTNEAARPAALRVPLRRLVRRVPRTVYDDGGFLAVSTRLTEAKKAAEANLIVRREETAAIRSQANSAKLLQENPTLMRLKELEVLEKVAANSKLNVVLGDKGLTERIVNVL